MTRDLLDNAKSFLDLSQGRPPAERAECAIQSLYSILSYLEGMEAVTNSQTVAQETTTDACWHCHNRQRLPDQILCGACLEDAAMEMGRTGVLMTAMEMFRPKGK
jgi:hypothetical protein